MTRSAQVEDVELGLADADGLDEDAVEAEGVQDIGRVGRRRREPAVTVAGGHRADEDAVVVAEVLHADPVAQEGSAREGARRVDGQDADGMAGPDGPAGQGGGHGALADAREAR